MKEIWAIGIIAMIVIGIGLTAAITDELSGRKVLPETSDELQELYRKYNITENDIKFAEGRLPHYLEGTILDGKVVSMGKITFDGNKVVVSEWVDPLFYDYCIKKGYKVIRPDEWFSIEEGGDAPEHGEKPCRGKEEKMNGR